MFTKITATALTLLALTSATPIDQKRQQPQPPKDQEFALALRAEGYPILSLNLAHVQAGESQAVFQRMSAYPGTPAYFSGTYVNFDVGTEYPYSLTFADVANNYGYKTPVYATIGANSGRDGFYVANGKLQARLTAALQSFFVCPTTVGGENIAGLFWGVYNSNGTAPEGCTTAEIVQNFNVEGGAKPPAS